MDLYRFVAEGCPDALSIHDLEGRYLWASPSFHDLIGLTPGDLVGRDLYDLLHPEDVSAVRVGHESIVNLPAPYRVQYRLRRADDTYRWVESNSRLEPRERLIIAVTRPIDQHRSALHAVEARRVIADRLRQIERERQHFLVAIAHRARHPVTVVYGLAETLRTHREQMDSATISDLVERLHRSAGRLSDLLQQATDAEELSRDVSRIKVSAVRVGPLIDDQVERATDQDAPITVTVPPDSMVFADARLLRIALRIMLDNALVHTPVGTPIWIRFDRDAHGNVIIVDDAGPGIPPAQREQIFSPFTRGDDDEPDPGLGLGLHTLAEIAAVHRGRAWVQERPGGGASFRLLLPYESSELEEAEEIGDVEEVTLPPSVERPETG